MTTTTDRILALVDRSTGEATTEFDYGQLADQLWAHFSLSLVAVLPRTPETDIQSVAPAILAFCDQATIHIDALTPKPSRRPVTKEEVTPEDVAQLVKAGVEGLSVTGSTASYVEVSETPDPDRPVLETELSAFRQFITAGNAANARLHNHAVDAVTSPAMPDVAQQEATA